VNDASYIEKTVVDTWKGLHDNGYFTKHPHYPGRFLDNGALMAEIRDAVDIKPDDDAVDIGCGYGRAAIPLAKLVHHVTGIDLHPDPIGSATARAEADGIHNATFRVNDGLSIPTPDESVSLVYSFSTFQHMRRSMVARYLEEIARVLKPGGRAYLQFMWGENSADFDPNKNAEQSVGWTDREMWRALRDLPFTSKVWRNPPDRTPASLNVCLWKRGPLEHNAEMEAARRRWNECHKAQAVGPLTGSGATGVLKNHALSGLIRSGMTVLDIGVGLGDMAKHLHKVGCTVDSMDIADAAEATVKSYIRSFYRAQELDRLPTNEYDFAISHLVAQHQWDRQLKEQIAAVFASLKVGGTFSLHLAAFDDPALNNYAHQGIPQGFDGSMGRTREHSAALIMEAIPSGAYSIKEVGRQMDWPHFGSYWYFFHIRKDA
jgi:ubiquinone/menaquinone biosynthesis C-methylase UbiE